MFFQDPGWGSKHLPSLPILKPGPWLKDMLSETDVKCKYIVIQWMILHNVSPLSLRTFHSTDFPFHSSNIISHSFSPELRELLFFSSMDFHDFLSWKLSRWKQHMSTAIPDPLCKYIKVISHDMHINYYKSL